MISGEFVGHVKPGGILGSNWTPTVKVYENFVSSKKCIFCTFSQILKFHLWLNRLVLTKFWLKYFRSIRNLLLMVFIFLIMVGSPKLKKKYLMVQTPPKKKAFFFWGGVWRLKVRGFGVCLWPWIFQTQCCIFIMMPSCMLTFFKIWRFLTFSKKHG